MPVPMTDDELELGILERYTAWHQVVETSTPQVTGKCPRELDMREVLREFTDEDGANLDYIADLWIDRLAPPKPGSSKGPLRRCSNSKLNSSAHKYHARAFRDPINNPTSSAWDRIRQLRQALPVRSPDAPVKELEQKFKILFSEPQAERDFNTLCNEAKDEQFPIGVLFIDIDHLKILNERHTETKVDKTILPDAQKLLRGLVTHRGVAYRHGGDEFVVLLPNHDSEEVMAFAEKVRNAFDSYKFHVDGTDESLTVSIGVAVSSIHGTNFEELSAAANAAGHQAKYDGRNTTRMATHP